MGVSTVFVCQGRPIMLRKLVIALTVVIALLGTLQNRAEAFWGHRHHHYHHGFYYGGYPSWGHSYTSLRIGFGFPRYRSYYVSHYPTYSYSSYYAPSYYAPSYYAPTYYCPPVYTSPIYVAPVYYSAPVYTAPVFYWPTCSTNTTPAVADVGAIAAVGAVGPNAGLPTAAKTPAKGTLMVSTGKPTVNQVRDATVPLVAPMPPELLKSADAIFNAGGYREAAAAYARLTVHYGNHDSLAVRRFVSLVASGQCDQAAVVVELASALDQHLTSDSLTRSSLAQFYGAHAELRKQHVELLADFALKHQEDAQALKMVGIWLQLDGQVERAEPFFERAQSLAPTATGTVQPDRLVAIKTLPLVK